MQPNDLIVFVTEYFLSKLLCHLALSIVLLFNIYFNYALCCATDPVSLSIVCSIYTPLLIADFNCIIRA